MTGRRFVITPIVRKYPVRLDVQYAVIDRVERRVVGTADTEDGALDIAASFERATARQSADVIGTVVADRLSPAAWQ